MILFRAQLGRRSTLVALARVANFVFFLLTAFYCLLTYSSFAYQQFIRPHLVSWLTGFVSWQHLGFWLTLLVTAWTMLPELRGGRGRALARGYLAVSTALGVLLLIRPVLPQVENDSRGLVLALAALIPPVWLALLDHLRSRPSATVTLSPEGRLLSAAALACVAVWVAQVVLAPWRLSQAGEIKLTAGAIGFGLATSAVAHMLVFAVLASVLLCAFRAARLWRRSAITQYWLLVALAGVAVTLIIDRLIFAAIAFAGWQAWLVSAALATAIVLTWSGVAHLLREEDEVAGVSAIDAWLAPVPGIRSRRFSLAALTSVILVQAMLLSYIEAFDWGFLLQKLCVVAVWFLAFAYAFGSVSAGREYLSWSAIAGPPLAGVLLFAASLYARERIPLWIDDRAFVPEFVLEGYLAVDPSYRVIHDALRVESRADAEFYTHLRASSLIQHVSVPPIDVDFVKFEAEALPAHRAEAPKPNIFLFVVDSLRRDYLSPYNASVGFTPAIGAFAKESTVFERAFTRYGGTGLAIPAIWTGGMLLHKQYVTPFDRMNTLLKMLEFDRYRRLVGMDSVVAQLMAPPPPEDELDRDVHIMGDRLCSTLEDLKRKLRTGSPGDTRPVFAYSLPQDIHISHIRSRQVSPGASYAGFFPPVAAQVEEMDRCFGDFIAFLKDERLYDESVVVITSDHGDSLGEGLRWGHSYTMFPEVSRIPLIIHVPERFREGLTVDPGGVALSTDLTPTFYALAGHHPEDLGPLYGRSLFQPPGTDLAARRNEPRLLASSYGAVYAVLRDNGSHLYIADAVNARDYAYKIGAEATARVGVTAEERAADRAFIRQWVDEIDGLYHFAPHF